MIPLLIYTNTMKIPKSNKVSICTRPVFICVLLLSISLSCSDNGDDPTNEEEFNEQEGPIVSCENAINPIFLETEGLVLIEIEQADITDTDWIKNDRLTDFSGEGYLVWEGDNSFQNPGKGLLTFNVRINNPGTYRFIWRSQITEGESNTESNDSWLRIADAKHFYGKKNNGHIVYPRGTQQAPIPESSSQNSTEPEGSSKEGWFKVYMNKGGEWHWQARTSDNDAHDIFAVFDEAGDYTVEISGRSKGHGIDKFLLFEESMSMQLATAAVASEITCD